MKLGKRKLIWSGAIAGLILGKSVSVMFFGELIYSEPSARHVILMVFFMIAGGFIGHVMRHGDQQAKDKKTAMTNQFSK